jgi:tRNA1(Val) A37 N6-methylase TrmN6
VELWQLEHGYKYNSDSLLLYDFISRLGVAGNVLDVGCGCGILGFLLKRDFPHIRLWSIDVQPINVKIAKYNMQFNHLDAKVVEGDFLKMHWDSKFDVIVSNPPYYHEGSIKTQDSHRAISRYSDNLPIKDFFLHVKRNLTPKGRFLFCYDPKQIGMVLSELMKCSLTPLNMQYVHPKAEKKASLVLIEAKKSSKGLCNVFSPMIMNLEDGYTKQAKEIFLKANTVSHVWA